MPSQTFQHQIATGNKELLDELKLLVKKEADQYFGRAAVMIVDSVEELPDALLLYTATYSPAPVEKGQ